MRGLCGVASDEHQMPWQGLEMGLGEPVLCWRWVPEIALRIISGCAATQQHFTDPLFLIILIFLLLFPGSRNIQGSYLTTIFQADLLTVIYSPQQGLWNKGKAWRKGRGNKNNLAYNQIGVNLIVATGLVSALTHTILLSQQWYLFVQNSKKGISGVFSSSVLFAHCEFSASFKSSLI